MVIPCNPQELGLKQSYNSYWGSYWGYPHALFGMKSVVSRLNFCPKLRPMSRQLPSNIATVPPVSVWKPGLGCRALQLPESKDVKRLRPTILLGTSL